MPEGAGSSVVESVEIQEDGVPHRGDYAGSGTVDGLSSPIFDVVRQGDRLAWVETLVVDGDPESGRSACTAERPGRLRSRWRSTWSRTSRRATVNSSATLWVGLTAGRAVWITNGTGPDGEPLSKVWVKDADGEGDEQVVATGALTFTTRRRGGHDDRDDGRGRRDATRHHLLPGRRAHGDRPARHHGRPRGDFRLGNPARGVRQARGVERRRGGPRAGPHDRAGAGLRTGSRRGRRDLDRRVEGDLVWSAVGGGGNTVYLVADALGDGQPQVLDEGASVFSAGIAGTSSPGLCTTWTPIRRRCTEPGSSDEREAVTWINPSARLVVPVRRRVDSIRGICRRVPPWSTIGTSATAASRSRKSRSATGSRTARRWRTTSPRSACAPRWTPASAPSTPPTSTPTRRPRPSSARR